MREEENRKTSLSDEQVTWFEEVADQSFDDDVFGACTTNTFSLSDYWGNKGNWCTATHECMGWCK